MGGECGEPEAGVCRPEWLCAEACSSGRWKKGGRSIHCRREPGECGLPLHRRRVKARLDARVLTSGIQATEGFPVADMGTVCLRVGRAIVVEISVGYPSKRKDVADVVMRRMNEIDERKCGCVPDSDGAIACLPSPDQRRGRRTAGGFRT